VVDRIQYKSRTSLSDNLRTHVWITDIDEPAPRQLTTGLAYDHALTFSPRGDEIAFVSNHELDPDAINNSDIFAVDLRGQVRQITNTKGCEYEPAWSPDGKSIAYTATRREVTTIDSVAEDRHVWVIEATGESPRELSAQMDRRARSPRWSPTSHTVYFLAGDHGSTYLHAIGRNSAGVAWRVFIPGRLAVQLYDAAISSSRSALGPFETVERADFTADGQPAAYLGSVHPSECGWKRAREGLPRRTARLNVGLFVQTLRD
jgi:dipeptidyl aminopeptidase/acylaminoacyl peptidase